MLLKLTERDNMPKISAVINTRNEEQNIRFCLESLKWCDEIIVVDMESDDKTVGIAREYTDKIYNHEKVLAFDIARKFAAEQATGEWILLIDADELAPKQLADKLKTIADTNEGDAVFIPFKNYLLGEWNKYTGWWPNRHCRFFKKDMMAFSERIHAYQTLKESAREIYLPAKEEYAIHHFAYKDSAQFLEKLNRYTTIEAAHLYAENSGFSYFKLFKNGLKEFFDRYIRARGYKDGPRGLFVSLMMSMYRVMSYIKLWELYENKQENVSEKYIRLKNEILKEYR
jgi:(heptosyl)LPS beta-1,4-glucosyltransferase